MKNQNIQKIIFYCKGDVSLSGPRRLIIKNISTDSRTIESDHLFLALKGDNFDGHYFIESCFKKGVRAFIIERNFWNSFKNKLFFENSWIILVNNSLLAYQEIAKEYLNNFNPIQIALTGSNGKTSIKEMIRFILNEKFNILATESNLNNQIGVPKTVLQVESHHEALLIEMGSGKKGDINRLTNILKPDYGIITNISCAHTEFLENLEAVALEKRSLFNSFHKNSLAILNEDEPYFNFLKESVNYCSFSRKKFPLFKILKDQGINGYLLEIFGNKCYFRFPGDHNLTNLHFALLLASKMSIENEFVLNGLRKIKPLKMRNEYRSSKYHIILDCYNANPSSMKAGLFYVNNLSFLKKEKKKICILGDMLELGINSDFFHWEIGEYLASLKYIDYLYTFGKLAKYIAKGAKEKGFAKNRIASFIDYNLLVEKLGLILEFDDLLYVKASRGLALEKVIEILNK